MESANSSITMIAEDVEIVGAVKCTGGIEIKGKLDGDLTCGGKAVIGESAVIKGGLQVESVSVMGQVDGNISAKDRIEMKSTARVNGDIKSKRLTVEDGVSFVGKSEVNPSGMQTGAPPQGEKPAVPPTGANVDKGPDADDKTKSPGPFGRK